MPGHKDIRTALAEGDVQIIELTRAQAREFSGGVGEDAKDEEVNVAFDEAQGEADSERTKS